MSTHRHPIPGVPADVERAAQAAWDQGAIVRVDGHCLCCRPVVSAPSCIRVAHIGGDYERKPGEDAALIETLRAAGFLLVDVTSAAWEWRQVRS